MFPGLTPLQLAARYNENRSVYSIAIQLTKRTREEKESIEKKRKMIRDMINEDNEEDLEDEDPVVQLNSTLQSSKQNLHSAKKFVTDLEHQLGG